MAETVKKAKSAPKPRKTASKKTTTTTTGTDPVTNHSVETHAHSNGHNGHVSEEEVARLAHKFWQERGHQHGNHIDDWFRAEQDLRGRAS